MSAECGASSPHIQELMTVSFKRSEFGQCLLRTKSILINIIYRNQSYFSRQLCSSPALHSPGPGCHIQETGVILLVSA